MDLSFIEHLIPNIAGWLHIEPATLLLVVGIILSTCNLVGRLIPDDATGWKGHVRTVCKFLGMYASNRVTTGVKTSDIVKDVMGQAVTTQAKAVIREQAESAGSLIQDVVDDTLNPDAKPTEPVSNPFTQFADRVKGAL